jgi:thiamine phosphate synthase YjbQ (UPF0047 family)
MKSFRKELWFNTPHRRDYINITPEVEAALRESGIREGLCLVNAMHITQYIFAVVQRPYCHKYTRPNAMRSSSIFSARRI